MSFVYFDESEIDIAPIEFLRFISNDIKQQCRHPILCNIYGKQLALLNIWLTIPLIEKLRKHGTEVHVLPLVVSN
jgi:hypothetical protein